MQEFLKSVNIWQSIDTDVVLRFLRHSVHAIFSEVLYLLQFAVAEMTLKIIPGHCYWH